APAAGDSCRPRGRRARARRERRKPAAGNAGRRAADRRVGGIPRRDRPLPERDPARADHGRGARRAPRRGRAAGRGAGVRAGPLRGLVAQPYAEARIRRVDVQHHEIAFAGDTEAVLDTDRGGDERAGPGTHDLVLDRELGLAFEDVERVDVVRVGVQVDALELGREAELEDLEVGQLGENAVPPDRLALARADDDARHRPSVTTRTYVRVEHGGVAYV